LKSNFSLKFDLITSLDNDNLAAAGGVMAQHNLLDLLMYLSNWRDFCEVIIIIAYVKETKKGPWGQEINDFEAT
jgi:hypothetical protein